MEIMDKEKNSMHEPTSNNERNDKESLESKNSGSQSKDQESLETCHAELAEWKDKFVRLSADFQNFKKRSAHDQRLHAQLLQKNLLFEILAILDNFDRAFAERPEQESPELKLWLNGLTLIQKDLWRLLEKHDVHEMESYETFNPEYHEAVMHVKSDEHEPGDIVEVLQKGYMIDGQVLRHAKVSVAQ